MASRLTLRSVLPGLIVSLTIAIKTVPAAAQEIVAEPDLTLFTVMAAINAAGYDEGADRMAPDSIRAGVRKDLEGRNIPSLEALREIYKAHRRADPGQDVSQYVSLALLSNGPPKFELMLGPANLPPDALELQEMVPLLAAFYEQADIPALWNKYTPAMEQDTERYQRLLTRAIQETNGYLRIETGGFMGLRFAVYLNPLAAPGLTDARNYGDNYYIVSSAWANLPEEEIRHGWLHYILDGYALKYPNIVQSKAALTEIAQRAPALDPAFRSDFSLLLTESLIRAIQARLQQGDDRARLASVQDAVEEGYLLAPYFYEALKEFVEQPVGMRLYFSEMVDGIDVDKEKRRLAEVVFRPASSRPVQEARWSPLEQMLRQAQEHMARSEYDQARQIYEALTTQYGSQAPVVYGLAMIASQQKEPEKAKQYFTQAAAIASDPRTKAWSHIYLGRILDLEGNRDAAMVQYSAALSVGTLSAEAKAAAEQGLQKQFAAPGAEPQAPAPETPPRVRVPMGNDPSSEGAR
jgi:tetratricopeptide (TPR) repeat protein